MKDKPVEPEKNISAEAIKQLNIDLPRHIHKRVRRAADDREVTIKQWVIQAIEFALAANTSPQSAFDPIGSNRAAPADFIPLDPNHRKLARILNEGTPKQRIGIEANLEAFHDALTTGVEMIPLQPVEQPSGHESVTHTTETTLDFDLGLSLRWLANSFISKDASRNAELILRSKNKHVRRIIAICADQLADGIDTCLKVLEADRVKANAARAKFIADAVTEQNRDRISSGTSGDTAPIRTPKSHKNEATERSSKKRGPRRTGTD